MNFSPDAAAPRAGVSQGEGAEREAEFWRTRQRESAGPDESDLPGSETRPN